MEEEDHYKILCVRPTATQHEIRTAYAILSDKYNPTNNPNNYSMYIKISNAFEHLYEEEHYDINVTEHDNEQCQSEQNNSFGCNVQ